MKTRRNFILIITLLVVSFFLFMRTSNAETYSVPPTSTIGSINGPGDVGTTTTTPSVTTEFVDTCLYVGDPTIGQTEWGLAPCLLPTTTIVAVDTPPVPGAVRLPATGSIVWGYLIAACCFLAFGFGLLHIRRKL